MRHQKRWESAGSDQKGQEAPFTHRHALSSHHESRAGFQAEVTLEVSLEGCVGVLQAEDRAEAFQAEPHGRECCLWSSGDSSQRPQPRNRKEGGEAGGPIVKGEQRVSHRQSPEPLHPPRTSHITGKGTISAWPGDVSAPTFADHTPRTEVRAAHSPLPACSATSCTMHPGREAVMWDLNVNKNEIPEQSLKLARL